MFINGLVLFLFFLSTRSEPISCITSFQTDSSLSYLPGMLASGLLLNDFGQYDSCKNDDSKNYIFMLVPNALFSSSIGLCLTKNCTALDFNTLIIPYIKTLNPMLAETAIIAYDPPAELRKIDGGGIAIICVISFLFCLSLIGSIKKMLPKKESCVYVEINEIKGQIQNESEIKETLLNKKKKIDFIDHIIDSFSLEENVKRLFTLRKGNLDFFNGMRALSLFYVIFGHEFSLRVSFNSNPSDIMDTLKEPIFLLAAGGFYAVDIFYYLAGFFLAFVLMDPEKQKYLKKPLSYISAIIHRYFRIMPSYLIALVVYWKIVPLLGDGPLFPMMGYVSDSCKNMWRNVLLIDDFYNDENCFGWGWYLSTDFQLFLFCLIVICIYVYSNRIGTILGFSSVLASLIYTLVLFNDQNYSLFPYILDSNSDSWFKKYYYKPYTRAAPYIFGLAIGISYKNLGLKTGFLYKLKTNIEKRNYILYIGYIIGLFLVNFFIFSPNTITHDPNAWSITFQQIFMTFSRIFYIIGIFLITLGPLLELNCPIGKLIGKILGFSLWGYIARLSFCTYLVHYFVIQRSIYNYRQSNYYNNESLIGWTIADLLLSLVLAGILSLLVEIPFMNIEKRIKK